MKILGHNIKPGISIQLNMAVARLHTRTRIEVPVIIERAKEPGPCLLLMAGIHGNEVNGIEIVRKIISKGYHIPQKGTIICIPVLNIFGFLNQQREFPDGRDLNRMFPGSANGSLASRFAHIFMTEILPNIDYCIDFHTGGEQRFNFSQIRIAGDDDETYQLAKVFGAKFIVKAKQREKTFRDIASKNGKKVLLFEGGKSLYLDKNVTNAGIQGAINIIHHLGLNDFSQLPRFYPANEELIDVESSIWIRAKYSGMFRSNIRIGSFVKRGEVLGTITDPFGDFEKEVKAPNSGYIFCRDHSPIVNQGTALLHLTTNVKTVRV
ncbi:MAG: succinylglutamate desuccinylase/aspartoacylase family protein [Prolixibacteraceae bacterium]|nr:succinylglutamate desuccinylase/aspartoacylase family protein [Prolixibacteraceae bacterium]MBN2649004.1 succinylglutamate desuccinylase/aspartoacylase family protein [Prolixibacteraceae bacterium]